MPNFVLLDIRTFNAKGKDYFQAIVMDDMYNVSKIFITEERANHLHNYIKDDITDEVSFGYKNDGKISYYQLYL